ncbi:MAG: hypothetical protein MRY83_17060 [Flavobacteriales bacterium]|nr:hypothetical protein [Flavobacteriales bacterium]
MFSQTETDTTNNYYFDDGGLSTMRNNIKFVFTNLYIGEACLLYERRISGIVSVETGVGVLLPYHNIDLTEWLYDENEIINPDLSFSFWLQPKFYFQTETFEGTSLGIQYRYRSYDLRTEIISHTDVSLNYNAQIIFAKRMTLEYSTGLGMRIKNYSNPPTNLNPWDRYRVFIPLNFRIGVNF